MKRAGVAGSFILSTLGVPAGAEEKDNDIDIASSEPVVTQIIGGTEKVYRPYDYENADTPYDLYLTYPTKEELIQKIIRSKLSKNDASVYKEVWDEQHLAFENEPSQQKRYFIETWKERTKPPEEGTGGKFQVDDIG